MAGKNAPVENTPDTTSVEYLMANDNTEWEAVQREVPTRVIFDTIGDAFIGFYQGVEHIPAEMNPTKEHPEGEAFDLYLFDGLDGKPYAFNKSTRLSRVLDAMPIGTKCRLTYAKDVEVKGQPQPMKDITVDVAKQQ